jgi:hypothetical protein
MSAKGEDRAEGFAEQSIRSSAAHPSQSSPDHQEQGDRMPSGHSLTGNTPSAPTPDPDRPKPEDRFKP